MPEFRGGMDVTLVEAPILVSLKRLHASLISYAQSGRWSTLPEWLRFPGSLERVHGFILDPETQDVVLVGRAASHASRRLDVDLLVLALRETWRDGRIMAVSLDPMPADFGGPQYTRVINVPPDSVAAKTMLDADYAMKHIMQRGGFAASEPLLDVAALRAEARPYQARFWLTPRALDRHAIHLSTSGRTGLFESNVDVMTEDMFVTNGRLHGMGQSSSVPERLAAAFNAAYPNIESASSVQPAGVFVRLHGLIDVVTLAALWRAQTLSYDVLAKFSELPYRRLTGAEAPPSYYPGIFTMARRRDGSVYQIQGGVELGLRLGGAPPGAYSDRMTAALEDAVRRGRASPDFVTRLAQPVSLPAREALGTTAFQRAVIEGERAIQAGDFVLAAEKFRQAVSEDPSAPDGHAGVARAMLEGGQVEAAAKAAMAAMILAPNDDAIRLLAMDIAWRHDPRSVVDRYDDPARQELSRAYYRRAALAFANGRSAKAEQFAGWAVDVWEDNGEAHFLRSGLFTRTDDRRSTMQMARAVRAFRRQISAGHAEAAKPLALVLSISAMQRLGRSLSQSPGTLLDVADLEAARDEARESIKLDSGLPIGPIVEALAGAVIALARASSGAAPNLQSYLAQADRAVARFGDHPMVYAMRASLRRVASDDLGALTDLDRAIALAPSLGETYLSRAMVLAALQRCDEARRDVETFRRLVPGHDPSATALRDAESCQR